MSSSGTPSFAPLSAANYPQWSGEMRAWLMKHGLWSLVKGEESEPPASEAAELKDWRKRRDRAAGEIYLAVAPEQRVHFGGSEDDPVKMWKALESAHVKHRPGARFNAYNSLFGIRKADDKTLSSLVARVETSMRMCQNLRPKDFDLSTMDDELQSMALIRALPEAYSSFVDALLLKDKLERPPSLTPSRTMKSTVLRPPLRPHHPQHCAHRPPALHTRPTQNATSVAISTTPWPSASSSRRPGSSPSSRAQSAPISAQIRPQVLRTTRNPGAQTVSPQPQRSLQEAQVFPLALRTSCLRSSSMLTSPGLQTQGPLLI